MSASKARKAARSGAQAKKTKKKTKTTKKSPKKSRNAKKDELVRSAAGQVVEPPCEGEAERFDPLRDGPELAYEHLHRYLLAAKLLSGLRVLDLGSGSGYGARLLTEAGCRVTAIDLAPEGLRGMQSALCGDAMRLPFCDGSFDAVVCFEAIEHVERPSDLVAEVARLLRGHALFMVSTPDREIYTDRAGHKNPYHIAEMTRDELRSLLSDSFDFVRLSGQGLWAGSWMTPLDDQPNGDVAGPRRVAPVTWQDMSGRAKAGRARWVAPEDDSELPVPVYLLGVCSNSEKGWNRVKRRLSGDSVLHDPNQWLLAQYEDLAGARTERNRDLELQIDQARIALADLQAQLDAARSVIGRYESSSEQAQRAMADLEKEIESSRTIIDRQRQELDRSEAASLDQGAQLEKARAGQLDLEAQIENSQVISRDLQRELAGARETIDARDAAVAEARRLIDEQAVEIQRARESIDRQSNELVEAARAARILEEEIEASRVNQIDLIAQLEKARPLVADFESQIVQARLSHEDLVGQLEAARSGNTDLETQLETARSGNTDLEMQLEAARSGNTDLEMQLEAARSGNTDLETQLEAARSGNTELEAQLETAQADRSDLERKLSIAQTDAKRLEEESTANLARVARTVDQQAAEIEAARSGVADLENQVVRARRVIDEKHREIELAAQVTANLEAELGTLQSSARASRIERDALRAEVADALARIDELERERSRFWPRLAHDLSRRIDRLRDGR